MKIPATIIYLLLVAYLFHADSKRSKGVSDAVWLPFIWVLFSAARPLSFWLYYWFGLGGSDAGNDEGNIIERLYLSAMIGMGLLVLFKRNVNWQAIFSRNMWIWLFFIYAAISFSWSDYPFVSMKRWFKSIGTVIMMLVVLSEERPNEAIGFILRRVAFLVVPLSILLYKYYPDLGRNYHVSGGLIFTGVTSHKNMLGAVCMYTGIYFAWNLLVSKRDSTEPGQVPHYSAYLIIIPMAAWIMYKANSATSLVCLLIGICLFVVGRQRAFVQNPRTILAFCLACILVYGVMESAFDVNDTLLALLGRRPDLTTRVPMWQDLLGMVENPLTGFGFESFWLGARLEWMISHWGEENQAHNGYLDMYLNLGYIGLILAFAYILSGLKKVYHDLAMDYSGALFRLCFILVFVLYNWTENAFHLKSVLWTLLIFSVMDRPAMEKSG